MLSSFLLPDILASPWWCHRVSISYPNSSAVVSHCCFSCHMTLSIFSCACLPPAYLCWWDFLLYIPLPILYDIYRMCLSLNSELCICWAIPLNWVMCFISLICNIFTTFLYWRERGVGKHEWGSKRKTFGSLFSPSIMWVLGSDSCR